MKQIQHELSMEDLEQRRLLDASAELFFDFQTDSGGDVNSIVVGEQLFFPADDGAGDVELWASDGSVEGTVRVKDIRVGRQSSIPNQLFAAKGSVFFTAYDDQFGRELWVSDGSEQGTVRLTDTDTDLRLANVAEVGDLIYFTAHNDSSRNANQIWQSDGTTAGTTLVMTTSFEIATTFPIDTLTHSNGLLFVGATGNDSGAWVIDIGRQTSKRIFNAGSSSIRSFHEIGGDIFFELSRDQSRWLRRIDLDTMQTKQVDIASSTNFSPVEFDGDLVYARTSGRGSGVFRTDGTEAGTTEILDATTAVRYIQIFPTNDVLYFIVSTNEANQLWTSDGTAEGTQLYFSSPDKRFSEVKTVGNDLYVEVVNNNVEGDVQLWRLSAEDLTTHSSTTVEKNPSFVGILGDRLLVRDGQNLLVTDGTQEGLTNFATPLPILSSYSGVAVDAIEPILSTARGGLVVLSNDRRSLYRSDGSISGTAQIELAIRFSDRNIGAAGDFVYFSESDEEFNLFALEPISGDLRNVTPPNANDFYVEAFPSSSQSSASEFYFQASSDLADHIWVSDGTREGTQPVLELDSWISNGGENLFRWNDVLIFHSDDGDLNLFDGTNVRELTDGVASDGFYPGDTKFFWKSGEEYYVSDGVATVEIAIGTQNRNDALAIGDRLYFKGEGGSLWFSDGTVDETGPVIEDAIGDFEVSHLVGSLGDQVLFAVEYFGDEEGGLWKSDGTVEGTFKVADVLAETWPGANALESGGYLYFNGTQVASDEVSFERRDKELWRTDGTLEGTVQVADIAPGNASSSPKYLTKANGFLYFAADDGFHGRELWRIPLDAIPGDADGNGDVNFEDFLLLSANFGMDEEALHSEGDFDFDGDIDFVDFLLLSANFGESYDGEQG